MSSPAPDMDVSVSSEPSSMLHVRASSMYPLPMADSLTIDTDSDSSVAEPLPFQLLCGEARLHAGRCVDGALALTNYRLFLQLSERHIHVPLALVDQLEVRDMFYLHVWCKDARSYRCTFDNNDMCMEWFRRLSAAIAPVRQLQDFFAFCFFAWASERENEEIVQRLGDSDDIVICSGSGLDVSDPDGTFRAEVERLGFDLHGAWRISQANASFRLCASYPPLLLVPACISDDTLETVARFRSARRVPAVVWRHAGNGAVIARCSQPEVGWLGWRSAEDEDLLKAIADACAFDRGPRSLADSAPHTPVSEPGDDEERIESSSSKKVLIMDARSYTTAVANRARGGGCECPEYYPSCDIQFMNLANIHSIRKSFQGLRALCAAAAVAEQPNWLSLLEGTRWLQHMSGLIRAAAALAAAVERDARPALVHCSDGWDRTPQIVALAQLLLDPHYRTLAGFRVLVEREWLGFGHKFADRCGHAAAQDDPNERCPVFLQWLDCVHQLQHQFPTAFQFSGAYLVKLAQHAYSCLFGTFLCNTRQERTQHVIGRTFSVWRYLNHPQFINRLYAPPIPGCHVLWPAFNVRDLTLWTDVYIGSMESNSQMMDMPQPTLGGSPPVRSAGLPGNTGSGNNAGGRTNGGNTVNSSATNSAAMTKTRSYGDLMGMVGNNVAVRRCSDPNIIVDSLKLTTLSQGESSESSDIGTNDVSSTDVSQHNGSDSYDEPSPSCTPPQQNGFGPPPMLHEIKCSRLTIRPVRDINHNGCGEDSDDADRSDSRSEVTLCSTNRQPKSTETSTDTLVAENGVITNNEVTVSDVVERIESVQNGASDGCEVCAQNRKFIGDKHLHGHLHIGNRPASCSNKPSRYSTPPPYCGPGPGGGSGHATLHGLDVDGLALIRSDVQHRLGQIQEEFRLREEALQRELHTTRLALIKQVCHNCSHHDPDRPDTDTGSLVGSVCSAGEREAGSVGDSLPSDLSWEALDEGVNGDVAAGLAAQRTLWVPDHAVSRCTGCSTEFWLGRRKHHCRSCGRIFCADCSENSAPLPSEELYSPVRVCTQCYTQLRRACSQHPVTTAGAASNTQPLTLTATSN